MHIDYSIQQLAQAAQWVLQQAGSRDIIALFAPMGAGKTTLSSAILAELGSIEQTSSPTFSIMNEHHIAEGRHLYHMDWYRLKDAAEAIDAGIEDALHSGHYCLIEWPERAMELLPPDALQIGIEITGTKTRRLRILNEH